jgi:hypothetical protein
MTECPATQPTPYFSDEDLLSAPDDVLRLTTRIKDLSTQPYITSWMMAEIAAIAELLSSHTISAGQVWQFLLTHYNISPRVSSTPTAYDDPGWLIQPLADRALIWDHLTALCANQELPPVPSLPGPYDDHDEEATALIEQTLAFLTRGLNLLESRCHISGAMVVAHLEYELRHDIEQDLAIQWLDSPFAIGATLFNRPLTGSGGFGMHGQSLYFLKALVGTLNHELAYFSGKTSIASTTGSANEARGRVQLWWMLLKGYVYAMLDTELGLSVPAMMLEHPELIADLKQVLLRALNVLQKTDAQSTPSWGGSSACVLGILVETTPTGDLIAKLDTRLAAEQHHEDMRASM